MSTPIFLPQLELNMESVQIVRWLAAEGDRVDENTPIIEVETQKSTSEVPPPRAGFLRRLLVKEGDRISEKEPIAILTETEDEPFVWPPEEESKRPETEAVKEPAATVSPAAPVLASPAVRRLAKEQGIDLATIKGSRPGGRITEADLTPQENACVWTPFSSSRLGLIRQMTSSLAEIPQIHIVREMDVTVLSQKIGESTLTHRLVRALGSALVDHPALCSQVRGDRFRSLPPAVAVAMDTPNGLFAPVVRRPASLSLEQVADAVTQLKERATAGTLNAEDLAEGAFALTNLGMLGVDFFQAFVFQGQTAVLAVGRARPQADQTVMAWFSLAADHRVIDGAEAARFLQTLQEMISHPS